MQASEQTWKRLWVVFFSHNQRKSVRLIKTHCACVYTGCGMVEHTNVQQTQGQLIPSCVQHSSVQLPSKIHIGRKKTHQNNKQLAAVC